MFYERMVMPAFKDLAILDRAPTPVSHTFVTHSDNPPRFVSAGDSMLENKYLTYIVSETAQNLKVKIKSDTPTVVDSTINGVTVPTVKHKIYAETTFTFAKTSSLQERKDAVALHLGAMDATDSDIDAVVTAVSRWF